VNGKTLRYVVLTTPIQKLWLIEIYEWLNDQLHIDEEDVSTIQIDGLKRRV